MNRPDPWSRDRVWDFSGMVAIVTGGGRGIGAATVKVLHHLGAAVAVTSRNPHQAAEQLEPFITDPDRFRCYALDLSDPDAVRAVIDRIGADMGRIDALVNNASFAGASGWKRDFTELPGPEFLNTLTVDLAGSWFCDQAVVPWMRRQGQGAIVHLASSAALMGDAETLLYSPAKMGLVGLTRSLARALAPAIRVNAVGPGSVRTHWLQEWRLTPEEINRLAEEVPMKRLMEPEEIAWTIAFLLSPAAAGITGQTWLVDGGMTMH